MEAFNFDDVSELKDNPILFGSSPDWDHWKSNACISANIYTYAQGYLRGAEVLVHHVTSTEDDADLLVYPIVFLYRHYVELMLKIIVDYGEHYLPDGKSKCKDKSGVQSHKFSLWWDEAQIILRKLSRPGDVDWVKKADAYIQSFIEIDDTSMGFRYPFDLKGKLLLKYFMPESESALENSTEKINNHINLTILGSHMKELSEFLNGSVDQLDALYGSGT